MAWLRSLSRLKLWSLRRQHLDRWRSAFVLSERCVGFRSLKTSWSQAAHACGSPDLYHDVVPEVVAAPKIARRFRRLFLRRCFRVHFRVLTLVVGAEQSTEPFSAHTSSMSDFLGRDRHRRVSFRGRVGNIVVESHTSLWRREHHRWAWTHQ